MKLYQAEVYNRGTWAKCYFYADSTLDAVTAIYKQCREQECMFGRVTMEAWRVQPCIYMPA